MTADTIYALSSGSPPAAIAIVRISGPGADGALGRLVGTLPPPRAARLCDVGTVDGRERIDRALVLRFPGPASATGEDVAELHLHGGRAVVAAVLAELSRLEGVRAAEPGEFTRRAFDNGRIDLSEAEGLADLLAAETQSQRRAALALAGGALSRRVAAWQARVVQLAAALEAVIDFSDEGEVGEQVPAEWAAEVGALAEDMTEMLERPPAERLKEGARIVVAGPPNAGKSSLLNYLAGREAAITSPTPGTTRDLVEAPISLGGVPLLLIDTAGLRESADSIEGIGVERARRSLADADVVLWLGAAGDCPERDRAILVQSKADVAPPDVEADLRVSSHTGEGMDALAAALVARAKACLPREGDVALNARQRSAVAQAVSGLEEALGSEDVLIAAEGLRTARDALDRITGRRGVEDMLDALFGQFCVGK
ncbi:MAG: tRNA uridine-5-carboxymethylaminomethyl(34) synthesis GTPase MnmE [Alphaproteobacteria bacterium]|nr:tRNA uridine-5-carboxymethylaminomethyl(34) synthesis GTPase MnmE [Alphaproteobacteria bacterium]MBV9372260.1 tRNA uridine-5-carboxymethylaminomethyl(34) synthesis GTPase MnmE [Alphaproteobacteria bacterium]MBV9901629.1 tRNA uridine-5-carboxymethylaminomethyl(34) synthesis GTPase MnmE [Alphaproteobacteria bacterium]